MQQNFAAVTHSAENLWCAFSLRCGTIGASKRNGEHHDEDTFYLPRQHLPQPDGGVRDEGLGEEGRACFTVPYRVGGHAARQLTNQDYDKYDLLIGMDSANLRNMHRICGGDFAGKLHLLMDYTDHSRDVADPWYTEDFESTWQDVLAGCQGLLRELLQERGEQNG